MKQNPANHNQLETEHCLTRQMNDNFSSCLTEGKRKRCNFAILFGDGYLCTHPRHRDFS